MARVPIVSTVFGGGGAQTAIMTPGLPSGVRRRLTSLDAAGLTDIGWSVVPPPSLPGDYNRNGVVDAADYIVWRNTRGQSVAPGSGADGSGNGSVGTEDYAYWRARFGMAGASGAGSAALVPEPAGGLILVIGGLIAAGRRSRIRFSFGRPIGTH